MRNLAAVLILVLMVSLIFANQPRINNSRHSSLMIPSDVQCRLVKNETPAGGSNIFEENNYQIVYICDDAHLKTGDTPERRQLDPGKRQIADLRNSFLNN